MKVCHVTSVHPAFDDRIFFKECLSLRDHYEVYLIASNIETQEKDGVHVVGVEMPERRISRVLKLNRIYRAMEEVDADLYHFHDPELMHLGKRIQKRGKRVIFDSHEDVPMQILQKVWIPMMLRKPLSKAYTWIEKRLLRQYNALISVTPTIVERLRNYNENTYQVTNYPIYEEKGDHRQWGQSICFAGGISPRYLQEVVLKSIEETDIEYRLAGAFEEGYRETVEAQRGWKNVTYYGKIPYNQVYDFIQKSTVGIAILDYIPNVGYKRGSLGVIKFFEYLSAGIPVVATDFDVWREVIDKHQCGIYVNPHDTKAIREAIEYLLTHPTEAKEMGDRGHEAVKKEYNWSTQSTILHGIYEKLLR